jgi:chloramphenicol-sensitive protein RarD
VSTSADPIAGLTVETMWLAPVGGALLLVVGLTSGITMGNVGAGHTTMLLLAGAMTSVPLLLFAAATARLTLVEVGIVQYVAPTMQFIFGITLLHEPMPAERWLGFVLVWIALVFFTIDLVRDVRRRRRAARAAGQPVIERDPTGEINVV